MSQLPRKVRRRLEREKRRRERNPKREKNLLMKGRGRKVARRPQKPPTLKATIAGAMIAKRKAEEHIKTLKIKLVELQTKSTHFTGRQSLLRRNMAFDTIDRIHERIKKTEDLIEVYNEWLKRREMIKKLGEEVKKNAPK